MMYFAEQMGYDFVSVGALVMVGFICSRFPGHTFDFPYLCSCIFSGLKYLSHFLSRFLGSIPMAEGVTTLQQATLQITAGFPRIQLNSHSVHPEIASDPTG